MARKRPASWWGHLGDMDLVEWLSARPDSAALWEGCPRGDWLLFGIGIGSTDRRVLLRFLCDLVRTVLPLGPADERLADAVDGVEAWTRHGRLERFLPLGSSAEACARAVSGREARVARTVLLLGELVFVCHAVRWAGGSRVAAAAGEIGKAVAELDPERGGARLAERVSAWRWPGAEPEADDLLGCRPALQVSWDRGVDLARAETLTTLQLLSSHQVERALMASLPQPSDAERRVGSALAQRVVVGREPAAVEREIARLLAEEGGHR